MESKRKKAHTMPADEHYTRISRDETRHAHPDCGCALTRDDDGAVAYYQCPMHAAAPDLLGWAEDAAHLVEAYRAYAEAMRKIGRGYHPSGLLGHSPEDVAAGLRAAIRKATGG